MKCLKITLLVLLTKYSFAQSNSTTQIASQDSTIRQYARDYLTKEGTIGISIGVIDAGKTRTYNVGETEKGNKTVPTSTTIYSIGSIAKTVVATLLAQAVIDKKCTLQDDIRKYLPDSLNFSTLAYQHQPVLLLHLSNHTSRIPSQLAVLPADWNSRSVDEKYVFKKKYTSQAFLNDLQKVKLDTVPGTKYDYSNAAVKLLTLILEKIYQQPYATLVETYIQKQAGMPDTKILLDRADWGRFASGQQDKPVLIRTKDINDFTSGPSLNSTVQDMLHFLTVQLAEKSNAVKLTHQQTWADQGGVRIGLVWRIGQSDTGDDYFFHSGQGWGCTSFCVFSVKQKKAVIVLVNETVNQKAVIDLGKRIFQRLEAN